MSFRTSVFHITLATLALLAGDYRASAEYVFYVSDLDISQMAQGSGTPQANQSAGGHTLSIGGHSFTNGIGTRAPSQFVIELNGKPATFSAMVGVDDEVGREKADVVFKIIGDQKTLWQSDKMRAGDNAKSISLSLTNIHRLALLVEGGKKDSSSVDWADAKLVLLKKSPAPTAVASMDEQALILTPKPSPKPRINSAKIFGVRPGAPFLYTIAATGERPLSFAAENLPAGLRLDPNTGIITGSLQDKGDYDVTLLAKNHLGRTTRNLKITCGSLIGLTPALGWNSWNCFASSVSADKVKSAADAMVSSGLIDHGWTYINIDEFWSRNPGAEKKDASLGGPGRDEQGHIVPNPRFPDMNDLTAYIHKRGLKAGIYSSPGPTACGGSLASFDHERLDAHSFAEWGFDYLKYDWCSYHPELERNRTRPVDLAPMNRFVSHGASTELLDQMRPYAAMRSALDNEHRDILFSFCQYGKSNVWEWGAEIGGNSWRTSGDIVDLWADREGDYQGSVSGIGFSQTNRAQYVGPGHFNDPDMLVVGKVGWGPALHPTRLTPNEQYTHISLWCLLAAPLLIGCDMTQMDAFTLNLLSNDEVLEVDQDPLGRQAICVSKEGQAEIWAKPMEDGSTAIGLFNRGYAAADMTVKWSDVGLTGGQKVRDLWRQKDLGKFRREFKTPVPRHGVVLVKVSSR